MVISAISQKYDHFLRLHFRLAWWQVTAYYLTGILPLLGNTLHKKKRSKNTITYYSGKGRMRCNPYKY